VDFIMEMTKVTAYIRPEIADKILSHSGTLNIVDAYTITDVQGASKIGGVVWMGSQKVFVCYCADMAKAIQMKDGIMTFAESGESIGFEIESAEVYVYGAK
jgi:hypothetical protein